MSAGVVVRGRMTSRRAVAAADVPAGLAHPQVHPSPAAGQALLAAGDLGWQLEQLHLIDVAAHGHAVQFRACHASPGRSTGSVWITTSARSGIRWRSSSSSSPASRWASTSDSPGSTPRVRNSTRPASVESSLTSPDGRTSPLGAPARAARSLPPSGARRLRQPSGRRAALERLQVGLHVLDLRPRADRRSTRSATSCAERRSSVGAGASGAGRRCSGRSLLVDRDVVGLVHERLGERDREDPVAQVEALAQRLDVDDDVAVRAAPRSTAASTRSAARWPSTTACPGATPTTRRRNSARRTRAAAAGAARCRLRGPRSPPRRPRAPPRACVSIRTRAFS